MPRKPYNDNNVCLKEDDDEHDEHGDEHDIIEATDKMILSNHCNHKINDDNTCCEEHIVIEDHHCIDDNIDDESVFVPITDLHRSQAGVQGFLTVPGAVPVHGIDYHHANHTTDYNDIFDDDETTATITTTTTTNPNSNISMNQHHNENDDDDDNDDDDTPYPVIDATLVLPNVPSNTTHEEVVDADCTIPIHTPEVSNVIVMDEQYMNSIQRNNDSEINVRLRKKKKEQRQQLYRFLVMICCLAVLFIVGVVIITTTVLNNNKNNDNANNQQQENNTNNKSIQNSDTTQHTLVLQTIIQDNVNCSLNGSTTIRFYCGKYDWMREGPDIIRVLDVSEGVWCDQQAVNVIICRMQWVQNITDIVVITFSCETQDRTHQGKSYLSNKIATSTIRAIASGSTNTYCVDKFQMIGTITQFCSTEETGNEPISWTLRPTVLDDSCPNGTIVSKGENYTFCQVSSKMMEFSIYDYVRDQDCINQPFPVSDQLLNLIKPIQLSLTS